MKVMQNKGCKKAWITLAILKSIKEKNSKLKIIYK